MLRSFALFLTFGGWLLAGQALSFSSAERSDGGPKWILLGDPKDQLAINYTSINLDGDYPVVTTRQKFNEPQLSSEYAYSVQLTRGRVDCAAGLFKTMALSFLDDRGRIVASLTNKDMEGLRTPEHIPMGMFKSFCLMKEAGLAMPDISPEGNWEELPTPIGSRARLFEAPAQRQLRNGKLLIKKKTVSIPEIDFYGVKSQIAIAVSLYDCQKAESHMMVAVRYDMAENPIGITFFAPAPDTPTLEANRKRFAAACEPVRR